MFGQSGNTSKQLNKNHEVIQLPCQKTETIKPQFDPSKAIVYLKLRNVGSTHQEAINFLKNRHCKQDTTQIFTGPKNFRILKLQKVNNKYLHQVLKGWLLNIPPSYDLGKKYRQSLLDVLVSTDEDEKMVNDLNKHTNALKYDYKKQEKFFEQYMQEVEEKIKLTGLSKNQLGDKLKQMNEQSSKKNQKLEKNVYTLKNTKDVNLIEIKEEVMDKEKQLFNVAMGNYPQVYNDVQMKNLQETTIKNKNPILEPVDLEKFLNFKGVFNKKSPDDAKSFSKEEKLKAMSEQFNESNYLITDDSPKKQTFSKFSKAIKRKQQIQKFSLMKSIVGQQQQKQQKPQQQQLQQQSFQSIPDNIEEEFHESMPSFQFLQKDLTKEQQLQIQKLKQKGVNMDSSIQALDLNKLNNGQKKNIKNMQKLVKGHVFVKSLFEVTQQIKQKKVESIKQTFQQEQNQQEIFENKVDDYLKLHIEKVNDISKKIAVNDNNNTSDSKYQEQSKQKYKYLDTSNLHKLLDQQQHEIEKYNNKIVSQVLSKDQQAQQRKHNIKIFSKMIQTKQKSERIKKQQKQQQLQNQSQQQQFQRSYIKYDHNKDSEKSVNLSSQRPKSYDKNQQPQKSIFKDNSSRNLLTASKESVNTRRISFKDNQQIDNFTNEESDSQKNLNQSGKQHILQQSKFLLSPNYKYAKTLKSPNNNLFKDNKFINPPDPLNINMGSTQYSIPSSYSYTPQQSSYQNSMNQFQSHRFLQKNSFYEQKLGYKTMQATQNSSNGFLKAKKSLNMSMNSDENLMVATTNAYSKYDKLEKNGQHLGNARGSQDQSMDNLPSFEINVKRQSFRHHNAAKKQTFKNIRNSMDNINFVKDSSIIQEYELENNQPQKSNNLVSMNLISPKKHSAIKQIFSSNQKL